jgi:hypothetical protein
MLLAPSEGIKWMAYAIYLPVYLAPKRLNRFRRNKVFGGVKGKGLPQQAEVAQGVPSRLRPRIFLTFSNPRVVGRQPYAPAAFTSGEIPGTHF